MNKIKLLTGCLVFVAGNVCQAATLNTSYEPGTLHIRVKQALALEIAKYKTKLPSKPCSKVKCEVEKYAKWGVDILFLPPFRRLFVKSDQVPYKFASIVPGVAPMMGLWLVGSDAYTTYVQERSKLVAFKYKVECLEKFLKVAKLRQQVPVSDDDILEKISWFLEEGYGQAHEALMNRFCNELEFEGKSRE